MRLLIWIFVPLLCNWGVEFLLELSLCWIHKIVWVAVHVIDLVNREPACEIFNDQTVDEHAADRFRVNGIIIKKVGRLVGPVVVLNKPSLMEIGFNGKFKIEMTKIVQNKINLYMAEVLFKTNEINKLQVCVVPCVPFVL